MMNLGKINEKANEIFKLYENEIGLLTGATSDRLKDLITEFSDVWLKEAILESNRQNKRNLAYIEKILENRKNGGQRNDQRKSSTTAGRRDFRKAPTDAEYRAGMPVGASDGDGFVKQGDGRWVHPENGKCL